jgi:carboxyl-terminal processing protease
MPFLNKSKVKVISGALILLILFAGFFALGASYGYAERDSEAALAADSNELLHGADFAPFWEAWKLLEEKHIDDATIKSQDKVWGAIKGLAGAYKDPYTEFFPPIEAKQFDESLSGSFGGVGIDVGIKDNILTVVAPLKDTPAYKAGIEKGDKIIKIDGTSTADMSLDIAISLIRGQKGTPVTLTIYREGDTEPREMTMTRETIEIPTLDTKYDEKNSVYTISLYQFSENAPELFQNALKDFATHGTDKLIIDLRGNPGGYLEVAVDLASWFLPEGKKVVIEDYGKNKEQTIYRSRGGMAFKHNPKIVILVDSGSASASEILAGALKENGVAKLVGETTFGKGVVQEPVDLTSDTTLKVTVAKWLTPKGNSINEHGLTPDYVVKMTSEDRQKEKDPQYDKAVQVLKNL